VRPYSEDLRRKVVAACDQGTTTRRELADLLGVSVAFVQKVWRQWRDTGGVAAKPPAGGRSPLLTEAALARLRGWVAAQPDLTLQELCARLRRETGLRVSVPTMCRGLRRLALPRKKSPSTPASGAPRASGRSAGRGGGGSGRSTRGGWPLSTEVASPRP
jgi:transposase